MGALLSEGLQHTLYPHNVAQFPTLPPFLLPYSLSSAEYPLSPFHGQKNSSYSKEILAVPKDIVTFPYPASHRAWGWGLSTSHCFPFLEILYLFQKSSFFQAQVIHLYHPVSLLLRSSLNLPLVHPISAQEIIVEKVNK